MDNWSLWKRGEGKETEKKIEEQWLKIYKFDITINPQNQEDKWIPSTRKKKKTTPMHIMIKVFKTSEKQKILKASRVKGLLCTEGQRKWRHQISPGKWCK